MRATYPLCRPSQAEVPGDPRTNVTRTGQGAEGENEFSEAAPRARAVLRAGWEWGVHIWVSLGVRLPRSHGSLLQAIS